MTKQEAKTTVASFEQIVSAIAKRDHVDRVTAWATAIEQLPAQAAAYRSAMEAMESAA